MSGRYAFSLPEPHQRDGWFRIGSIDITSTAFMVVVGVASMFAYAIDAETTMKGAYESGSVRDGELWRIVTWPFINPPSIWALIAFWVFWTFGHRIEEQIGRKPMAWILGAMTVIPAAIVALLGTTNTLTSGRWSAFSFGIDLFAVAVLALFGLDQPNARFFFGLPAWVIAAAIVGINALQLISVRAWAQLLLGFLVIAVGGFGIRQRGMLDTFSWIPQIRQLAGPRPSPYGEVGSARKKSSRFGLKRKGKGSSSSGPTVVSGPWGQSPVSGPTPLEQAELDVLLDKISASGIESLTREEKDRLNALSKRMRGN